MINTCLFGDVRDKLRDIRDAGQRVNVIITSPPYWGLRDYGIPPSVWGGDPNCAHDFIHPCGFTRLKPDRSSGGKDGNGSGIFVDHLPRGSQPAKAARGAAHSKGDFCECGAWLGCLGLEPTPAMFIEHIVEVFRLAREVLTDDGTLWMNLGDSYSNDGKWGGETGGKEAYLDDNDRKRCGREKRLTGLKPKNLCMIPARCAIALQDDGWYLRSALPWIKRNGMPESTDDRPAQSVEYVYMLTKKPRYFYDHEAVKVVSSPATYARLSQANLDNQAGSTRGNGGRKHNGPMKAVGQRMPQNWHQHPAYHGEWRGADNRGEALPAKERKLAEPGSGIKNNESMDAALSVMPSARRFRVTNPFFDSWQGLWTDEDGEPLALIVNSKGYKEAHFATFPPKLVEPLILASTSAHGHCPKCGAGWERVTEKGAVDLEHQRESGSNSDGSYNGKAVKEYAGTGAQNAAEVKARVLEGMRETITTGWQPTCKCGLEPVRAVVLDTFFGSGTTGQVAQSLGRDWIGIDLNEAYGPLQEDRTRQQGLALA